MKSKTFNKELKKVKLKAGTGYWETSYFPIGGYFRRASCDGLIIYQTGIFSPYYKGANAYGITEEGKQVAYDTNLAIELAS